MSKFIVLVYSGAGTSPSAVYHTKKTLKSILSPYHIVSEITAQSLLSDPWPNFCSLLVMPGGRDTPYHDALSGAGNAKIKKFVEDGGSYLGICAGGYYGAKEIKFMLDDDVYRVHVKRELAFWPGTCEGLVFPGFKYQTEEGSRPVEIELNLDVLRRQGALDDQSLASSLESPAKFIYYNGGGAFFPPETGSLPSTAQVVARYSEKEGSPAAVVFNAVGKGRTMMMGMHPEYSLLEEPLLASLHRHLGDKMPNQQTIVEAEANRVELVRVLLAALNVRLPSRQVADLELLQRPTRPLPQFLISNPSTPLAIKIVEDSLKDHFVPSSDPDAPRILKDANDTFYYHQSTSFPSVSDFLTQSRTTALSSEEEEDLNSVPKHVIVASHENALDVVKAEGWCPLWNFELYFKALEEERSRVAEDKKTLLEGEKWRYGDVFFYSEAVSSTQTMLEKYVLLLLVRLCIPSILLTSASMILANLQESAPRHVPSYASHLARELPARRERSNVQHLAQPDRLPPGFDLPHPPDHDGSKGRLRPVPSRAGLLPGTRPCSCWIGQGRWSARDPTQVAERHLRHRQEEGRRRQGCRGEAQDGGSARQL